MSVRRNVITGLTLGLIFIGAMFFSDDSKAKADPVVDVVASDCHIVPPRGLPQPCDYDSGWNEDGIRDTAIVGGGCAFGALNGGGPWGCAAGAVAAWAGILFGDWKDRDKDD